MRRAQRRPAAHQGDRFVGEEGLGVVRVELVDRGAEADLAEGGRRGTVGEIRGDGGDGLLPAFLDMAVDYLYGMCDKRDLLGRWHVY